MEVYGKDARPSAIHRAAGPRAQLLPRRDRRRRDRRPPRAARHLLCGGHEPTLAAGVHLVREWRGRGIGSASCATRLRWAEEHEYHRIEADIFTTNERSLHLFRKAGFREEPRKRRTPSRSARSRSTRSSSSGPAGAARPACPGRHRAMCPIVFESIQPPWVHNPLNGFALEEQRVEVRRDPLLGDTSVLNPFLRQGRLLRRERPGVHRRSSSRARRPASSAATASRRGPRATRRTRPGRPARAARRPCCRTSSRSALTTRWWCSRGRIPRARRLHPRAARRRARARPRLPAPRQRRDPAAPTPRLRQHLLPAGASIVHPHLQLLATPLPYTHHGGCSSAAVATTSGTVAPRFVDLAARRSGSARASSAGRGGGAGWPPSPEGSNEVVGSTRRRRDFAALPDAELAALADGDLARARHLRRPGCSASTTRSTRSGADAAAPGFRLFLRIVSRRTFRPPTATTTTSSRSCSRRMIVTPPEELARTCGTPGERRATDPRVRADLQP